MFYAIMHTIIIIVVAFLLLCIPIVLWWENKKQVQFEKKVSDEWKAMSAQEKLDSGRDCAGC